jgi:endoglucanase
MNPVPCRLRAAAVLAGVALLCLSAFASAQIAAGDLVFQADFERDGVLREWRADKNPHAQLVPGATSAHALEITVPAGSAKGDSIGMSLPIEKRRGARIQCEARVKADGVTAPPNPWNGVKFMLHITGPAGSQWPQANNVHGTFDWKKLRFTTRVPKDATAATLQLGLEQVTGKAAFDDICITVLNTPRPKPTALPPGPAFKGHSLPRLRGAMIGQNLSTNDLLEFGQKWGANHVRWQLLWGGFPHSPADNGDLKAYYAWMDSQVKRLDAMLPVCEQAGLMVLIDIHTPPGGRDDSSACRLFHEKRFQDSFVGWWDKLSKHFRGNKTVWGYDLVNEPVEGTLGDDCLNWQQLATVAARAIRTNDPDHAIIMEPEPWGGPESVDNLAPLPVPGVVYSAHMYLPHNFTHQGVYNKTIGLKYPGEIAGQQWDKDRLRKALQPVIDFQRDYGVHIYIGEFSAIRWAPDDSAYRYLRDCIEIFEENGWDWAYHAFREWSGWSVEHAGAKDDNARSPTPTSRELLLKEWFARNAKAASTNS